MTKIAIKWRFKISLKNTQASRVLFNQKKRARQNEKKILSKTLLTLRRI